MKNIFLLQALHKAVGDKFIIFRCAQMLGDVFEGEQESGKIFVAVERIDLRLRNAIAVTLAEFEQRGGFDCALEVQVEVGLGEKAQETARRAISGRHCFLIVDSWGKICEGAALRGNRQLMVETIFSQTR